MPDQSQYYLSRDKVESVRLENQHRLWCEAVGYHVHPSASSLLQKSDPRIAEFATGTGIWLREVGSTLPASAQLLGLDISAEQFPSESQRPANLELSVADIIYNSSDKLPPQYLNRFDLVHIRLLVGALPRRELWEAVARNALAVLRPGGALQWEDGDFTAQGVKIRTTKPGGSTAAIEKRWATVHAHMGGDSRFSNSLALDDVFRTAGLERVEKKHFNVGEAAKTHRQKEWADVQGGAIAAIFRNERKAGGLGPEWTEEVEKKMDEDEAKEFADGAYYDWDIVACVGFKPSTA